MKKLFLLLSIIFLCSCSKNDELLTPLSVSTQKIEINSLGAEEKVIVSSEGFTAQTSESWVQTKIEKNTLTLIIEKNTQETSRKTEVIVAKCEEKLSISVIQRGSVIELELSETETTVSSKQGNYSFSVQSNSNHFQIVCNDSWITVNEREENSSEVLFSVEQNPEKTPRQARISVMVDNVEKATFIVNQKGNFNFTLPSFAFGSTTEELTKTEDKRFRRKSASDTGTGTLLRYEITGDDLFGEISYLVNLNAYVKSSLYVKGGAISDEDKKNFEDFLQENGFQKITEKGYENSLTQTLSDKTVFVSEQKQAKIEFMNDNRYHHYTITYRPYQSQSYPTLSALPEFNKGLTKEEVETLERGKNGTLNSSVSIYNRGKEGNYSDFLFFNAATNNNHLIGRGYYVYRPNQTKTGLTQVSYYYDIHELALWRGLDGKYYPTREFTEFAESQGYSFYKQHSNGSWLFKNDSQIMSVIWQKDSSLGWVLRISIY